MKNTLKKQDEIKFKDIFKSSFKEYKTNFNPIFKFMFLFLGMFILFNDLLNIILVLSDKRLFNVLMNPTNLIKGAIKLPFYYNFINIILTIILFLLLVFIILGFANTSIKKSKFSFRDLVKNGITIYGKFLILIIVLGVFISLLSLLLIIPGIIFLVYWIFAIYVFLDKKEKILPSLKKSRELVKNRWWKIFGCIILILIIGVLLYLGNFMFTPFDNVYQYNILNGIPTSFGFLLIYQFLMDLYLFIKYLILLPISILFFKNLYLKLKKEKINNGTT